MDKDYLTLETDTDGNEYYIYKEQDICMSEANRDIELEIRFAATQRAVFIDWMCEEGFERKYVKNHTSMKIHLVCGDDPLKTLNIAIFMYLPNLKYYDRKGRHKSE